MSDAYDYPDADAIPSVKPNALHALTREQVEIIAGKIRNEYIWKHEVNYWLNTDAALRQALAQQAQEMERLQASYDADMKHWTEQLATLTREQVEHHAHQINHCEPEYISDHVKVLLDHDASMRQSMSLTASQIQQAASDAISQARAQQAQEVERLTVELEECKHQNGISAREIELEQQLAAMTTERDEACGELLVSLDDAPIGSLAGKLVTANRVLRSQLASSQARVQELEYKLSTAGKDFTENMLYQGQLERRNADLQATLTAAQARVARLRVVINTILFQVAQGKVLERDACITAAKQVYEETA